MKDSHVEELSQGSVQGSIAPGDLVSVATSDLASFVLIGPSLVEDWAMMAPDQAEPPCLDATELTVEE